jgi:predicted Zn-ribbon and HTH transcriptional regulator
VVQVDAANPGAVRVPIALPEGTPGAELTADGTVYRAPAAFHVQTHHYCYPDTGIEMPLGALPVVECNRWDPDIDVDGFWPEDGIRPASRRNAFLASPAGLTYRDAVACWEEARAAEQTEAAEAERLIARSMDETPTIACQVCGKRFEEHEVDVQMRCRSCVGASLQPRANLRYTSPHKFAPGKFKRGDRGGQQPEETCDVCGYDPRNVIHHTETP